jgi:hypothetical protein
MKNKFNSQYYIEYRFEKNGPLFFIKNNLNNLDQAMAERERIIRTGAYEALIKKNEFLKK